MVTKENKQVIFEAMKALIEKKGGRNKMTSIYHIEKFLREQGVDGYPQMLIRIIIDEMISTRIIRYKTFEEDGKRYTYYGIPKAVWSAYDEKRASGQ